MFNRILEPEVMESADEAAAYDLMDHQEVNQQFVTDLLTACSRRSDSHEPPFVLNSRSRILDLGTGNAAIPVRLLQQRPDLSITATDLSSSMLQLASRYQQQFCLENQLQLICCDACHTIFPDHSFDVIFSNSLIHHIPEPLHCFAEMARLLQPGGRLFVRDLFRPDSRQDVESLVKRHAGDQTLVQQQLLRQSLQAALRREEVEQLLVQLPTLQAVVTITSDRHWTVIGHR